MTTWSQCQSERFWHNLLNQTFIIFHIGPVKPTRLVHLHVATVIITGGGQSDVLNVWIIFNPTRARNKFSSVWYIYLKSCVTTWILKTHFSTYLEAPSSKHKFINQTFSSIKQVFSCTTPIKLKRNTVCSTTDHNATSDACRFLFFFFLSNPIRSLLSFGRSHRTVRFINEEVQ
jgi:hypothetical protein